jgi:hypothetical protein
MRKKISQTHRYMTVVVLLLCQLVLAGCLPAVAFQELTYRPSPDDPYQIWQAYITESGLLFLCGSVDNDLEGMERVHRVYNLELRLEETLDPLRADKIQVLQIDNHPSLQTTKGYLSDLCQFDEKRVKKRPNETGWIEIFMDSWDEGFEEIDHSDIEAGRLPIPPNDPRVVLYRIYNTDPPEYLLMGQLQEGGPAWSVLLILGSGHIEDIW